MVRSVAGEVVTDSPTPSSPAQQLTDMVHSQFEHAVDGAVRKLKVYESLRNLGEVIGTQYGDRVIYELVQNAHDAHPLGERGKISVKLVIRSENEGELYVANKGRGFRIQDVEAIRNLATSRKEIGESIGNKGLGFRSVEALTRDVRIWSQTQARAADRFDGFCFRFADEDEIKGILTEMRVAPELRDQVARTIPRYLASIPIGDEPPEISRFARDGYATVIMLPLQTREAVDLAIAQVESLIGTAAPLSLFLDRIDRIYVHVERPDRRAVIRTLYRHEEFLADVPDMPGCALHRVSVGEGRDFLVVRRVLDKRQVLNAVRASLAAAPPLKRWLEWKGDPVVSVAVPWGSREAPKGRLYNFLPMGEGSQAPLAGHIDAPFFADIDRRTAKLNLPLNDMLMDAAAEACAAAAKAIAELRLPVPGRSVFDLVVWESASATKIERGFQRRGHGLRRSAVLPVVSEEDPRWASLSDVVRWPDGQFRAFGPKQVASWGGAALIPPDFGAERLVRLEALAMSLLYRNLAPRKEQLAVWAEAVAKASVVGRLRPSGWAEFYEELRRIFAAIGADVKSLAGRQILLDRSGKLQASPTGSGAGQHHVFIRPREKTRGRRAGPPLPPYSLSRKLRFFDERIPISPETVLAFEKAGLLRRYDPVEALAGIDAALEKEATNEQRREALVWAFKVLQAGAPGMEKALAVSRLRVPTRGGWLLARSAAFSGSWTPLGRVLETYLTEASDVAADCRAALGWLLIPFGEWPTVTDGTKANWRRFLEALKVRDGLPLIHSNLQRKGVMYSFWSKLLQQGQPTHGFDEDWCEAVRSRRFHHPYTEYELKGLPWRFPGQTQHQALSDTAKERLCELILAHLKESGDAYFEFELGRFSRPASRDWDKSTLPTPLAVFLKSKAWVAATSPSGVVFRQPSQCWSSRTKRPAPPRFVDRLPAHLHEDILDHKTLEDLIFSDRIGLRDWSSRASALTRLIDLAAVATELSSGDRRDFRDDYRTAWVDAALQPVPLPADLRLVVVRRGQTEAISGSPEAPAEVLVTQDPRSFAARVLSEAARPILDIGDADPETVIELLSSTGVWAPSRVDGRRVQLLVDGQAFTPGSQDPTLTSQGLEWLPEAAVLGSEILGRQLERGLHRSDIDARCRAIRLRRCERISLVVDGVEVTSRDGSPRIHALEHATFPTLIVAGQAPFGWRALVAAAEPISRLVYANLRSLETLLLRLNLRRTNEGLDRPDDEDFAEALSCETDVVREHLAALRSDTGRLMRFLVPLAAYWGSAESAMQLRADADRLGAKFDPKGWLTDHLRSLPVSPAALIAECEAASDLADLRRRLGLDYARFNSRLAEIGEPMLSCEADLRRLYDAYLKTLKPSILERLRRSHLADFRGARSLAVYTERKTLAFLEFDTGWIQTRETLESETVEAHIQALLDTVVGLDSGISDDLPPLGRVLDSNRRAVQKLAQASFSMLTIWCRRSAAALPGVWQGNDPQAVMRALENAGLLDFEIIPQEQFPVVCRRAGIWPDGMPVSLASDVLGITEEDLKEESRRQVAERARAEVVRNTIDFAGKKLDSKAPDFIEAFREIAEERLGTDKSWLQRSRHRLRLKTFEGSDEPSRGGSGGSTVFRRGSQPPEALRDTMGLVGEWLAFQYLKERHPGLVDEDSWISGNRMRFFGGSEGNDAAGYDFEVVTSTTTWLYEVKSALDQGGEFELTANEMRVAASASSDGKRRYRILYVPFVLNPDHWCVLELPNPMSERSRRQFRVVGRGSVRIRFETL